MCIYTPYIYICHISHISHGRQDWGHLWSHSKKSWCCDHQDVGCGHWEKVVHVVQTYDCHAGFKNLGVFRWFWWFWWLDGWFFRSRWEESSRDVMDLLRAGPCIMAIYEPWSPSGTGPKKRPPRNWFHGWSGGKKEWCCAHKSRGCPGDFHGHWQHHIKVHVEQHGVGHGGACGCELWGYKLQHLVMFSWFSSSDLGSIMTETLIYPQEFDIVYISMFTQRIRDKEPVRGTLWLTPDTLVKSSYVHLSLVGLRRLSWRDASYIQNDVFCMGSRKVW